MFRLTMRRAAGIGAALALVTGGALAAANSASAAEADVTAECKIDSWGSGFGLNCNIKNNGSTPTTAGWNLELTFSNGVTPGAPWSANMVSNGGGKYTYTPNAEWNKIIGAGGSVSFGSNGTATSAPSITGCKVFGHNCSGGGSGDTQAPSKPGKPVGGTTTASSITVSWPASTDNVGVTGYTVFLNGASKATATDTNATISGLAANTTYKVTVQAKDAAGNQSALSDSTDVKTQTGGGQKPPAPTGLASTGKTSSSVSLKWNASTGATSYTVYVNGEAKNNVTGTSTTVADLASSTAYKFTVRAKNASGVESDNSNEISVTTDQGGGGGGTMKLGYFAEWGIYDRGFIPKKIVTSGAINNITHINYAFARSAGGRCAVGDAFAAYEKAYTAAESVDGVADAWDAPLKGNFGQLRKLKKAYPGLKVVYSVGGWTWSDGFTAAAQNPTGFADSCYALVKDPRWADVFDGIDVDWEYPNACGLGCDASGDMAYSNVMKALRNKFGASAIVSSAITADGSAGGKISKTKYGDAVQYVNYYLKMDYDFFGAWAAQGPTAPHSPLTSWAGIPQQGFTTADSLAALKAQGVPANKIAIGIGFYGRGWTGVTQSAPGGSATGPAPGKYEAGIQDYKDLYQSCPSTAEFAGTAYAHCGSNWYGYDTPATIKKKMAWAKQQGLAGAFFWEFNGDTEPATLSKAIKDGLG